MRRQLGSAAALGIMVIVRGLRVTALVSCLARRPVHAESWRGCGRVHREVQPGGALLVPSSPTNVSIWVMLDPLPPCCSHSFQCCPSCPSWAGLCLGTSLHLEICSAQLSFQGPQGGWAARACAFRGLTVCEIGSTVRKESCAWNQE